MSYHEEWTPDALGDVDGRVVPLRAFPAGPIIGRATTRVDELGLHADVVLNDSPAAQRLRHALSQPLVVLGEPMRIIPLEHFLRYGDVQAVRQARALAHCRILGRALLAPFERLLDALTRR